MNKFEEALEWAENYQNTVSYSEEDVPAIETIKTALGIAALLDKDFLDMCEAMQWQPVEKKLPHANGKPVCDIVLAWFEWKDRSGPANFAKAHYAPQAAAWCFHQYDIFYPEIHEVTHWMPQLPTPEKAANLRSKFQEIKRKLEG